MEEREIARGAFEANERGNEEDYDWCSESEEEEDGF